jgi:putative transposase
LDVKKRNMRLDAMARLARVIGLDLPHHVTQRGNGRRFILDNDNHRRIYLDLLTHSLELEFAIPAWPTLIM